MGRVRSPIPRSRLPLHRRAVADPAVFRRWLLVVALATLTALLTNRLLTETGRTRERWGRTRPVLVLRHPVAAGDPLAGSVETVRWPVALTPRRAVTTLPSEARAAGPLDRGAPVTAAAVAPADLGRSGDRRRVAVPVGAARLPLARGDRVDVWATVDPSLTRGRLATRRIADDAIVASAGNRSVVVAVDPREVADVAEAAALATVTLVATG